MAIAYVQSPTAGTSTGTTVTTGSATYATGSTLIAIFTSSNGAIAVNSITQSSGSNNWFACRSAIRNSSPALEVWVALNITGFTGTITGNLSGSSNHVLCAGEYSGVSGVGVGNSSAPTATTNPSLSLTTSGASVWVVGGFSANNTNAFTAGTGSLRSNATLTNVGGALVDNGPQGAIGSTGTVGVTHASANWGIGCIELYPDSVAYGNFAVTGEGFLAGYHNYVTGVQFTTGANSGGYTLNSSGVFVDNASSGSGNIRTAIYGNQADPNKALIAEGGSIGLGIPAGSGTVNLLSIALTGTLAASTTYWVTFNIDASLLAYRIEETDGVTGIEDRYRAWTFGAAPSPWGTTAGENYGPRMWVNVTPVAAAGRVSRNTHPWPLGVELGMHIGVPVT